MNVRASDLVERPSGQPVVDDEPVIDDYGLLRCGSAWVALSPIEAGLAREFLVRHGELVGRDALGDAGWPDGVPNVRSVDYCTYVVCGECAGPRAPRRPQLATSDTHSGAPSAHVPK